MKPEHLEHNEAQRRYFTGRSLPRMDPTTRSATPYTLRHVDAVVRAAGITPGDRVLDVGCGPGKYTLALAARGVAVEGIDLTPALVDQLHAAAPAIVGHVGDIADPPPSLRGAFDVVVGFFVLHHIDDLAAALAGVRSLLRPGGRAAFVEPNPLFPGYYVQIAFTGMTWARERGMLQLRPRTLERIATVAGLEGFRTERFGAFPPALANRRAGRAAERALEAVPGWRPARAFQLFSMRVP